MPKKFDFVSPGVEFTEVDLSQVVDAPEDEGILIVGTAPMGPSMQPVRVRSKSDLHSVFGLPIPGGQPDPDTWRNGNKTATTYGLYAAEKWLENAPSPVTYIRLAGQNSATTDAGYVNAGWDMGVKAANGLNPAPASCVGSYGLFVFPSASHSNGNSEGTLAAVFYTSGAALTMGGVGFKHDTSDEGNGDGPLSHTVINSVATNSVGEFKISNGTGPYGGFTINVHRGETAAVTTVHESFTFHLDPTTGGGFIRNVADANPNPQKLKSIQFGSANQKFHFLGESFETNVYNALTFNVNSSSAGKQMGILMPLVSGSHFWNTHQKEAAPAKTGFFINRDPSPETSNANGVYDAVHATKLFRLVSLHEGEHFQNSFAVIISDLNLGVSGSPATFTIKIVAANGATVEQFSNLTMDSNSPDYIAKRIGDQNRVYDSTSKTFDVTGEYVNKSDYVRVELSDEAKAGLSDKKAIPFGFLGPQRPRSFQVLTGSQQTIGTRSQKATVPGSTTINTNTWVSGAAANRDFFGLSHDSKDHRRTAGLMPPDMTAIFRFGSYALTTIGTAGGTLHGAAGGGSNYNPTDLFGVRHALNSKSPSSNATNKDFFHRSDYKDVAKALPSSLDIHTKSASTEFSFVFTLDEMKTSSGKWFFESGSHSNQATPTSYVYTNGNGTQGLLDQGVKQFVAPFFGGCDGLDILQADPFSQRNVLGASKRTGHYAVHTIGKAIDIASDRDQIRHDLISIPGLMHTQLTQDLINVCEDRADSLAIIDLDDSYLEKYENNGAQDTTNGTALQAISNAKAREYDTSYAATYHPRVKLNVGAPTNTVITVPPSVAAIAAIGQSDNLSDPWFAPAGFNRGGLEALGFTGVHKILSKAQRDDLYQLNVNPIARFGAIGRTVIFGQKTLQRTASALDRINVRRLMIYLKTNIGRVADSILFENSVEATFNNFRAAAGAILSDVQTRFGITEFKLVLDETTTTPDLIDRNIMYAKIFIKPARSIEFIAIDFIITRSGIEF